METTTKAKVSVSLYQGAAEKSYTTFEVTPDGLRAARELLATRHVNGFRHRLSDWQFDDPYGGQLDEAYRLVEAGDADGLADLLRLACPRG
jgi:hypothetical protein